MSEDHTVSGALSPEEKTTLQSRLDAMDVATLVKSYRDVKAKIAEIEARADKPRAMLKEVEGVLMARLIGANASSIKTENGTVYIYTTTNAVIEDPEAFWRYAVEHDASDLYQARAVASTIITHQEAGETVPGVRISSYSTARVRKS